MVAAPPPLASFETQRPKHEPIVVGVWSACGRWDFPAASRNERANGKCVCVRLRMASVLCGENVAMTIRLQQPTQQCCSNSVRAAATAKNSWESTFNVKRILRTADELLRLLCNFIFDLSAKANAVVAPVVVSVFVMFIAAFVGCVALNLPLLSFI